MEALRFVARPNIMSKVVAGYSVVFATPEKREGVAAQDAHTGSLATSARLPVIISLRCQTIHPSRECLDRPEASHARD
jgi:hypothetical protein